MPDSKDSTTDLSGASRRDFLKTSSVVGAGVAANLIVPRMVHAAGDDKIRIGLVGCGGRGTGAAVEALLTQGNVQLIAMADAFPDRLEKSLSAIQGEMKEKGHEDRVDVPPERRFIGFDACEKVSECDVELMILAAPPGFRPAHFYTAITHGRHVFMEKPIAVDAPGVRSVLKTNEIAKQLNRAVGVGLQRRHQKSYIETIERVRDGAIGDVINARVYWNSAGVWVKPRTSDQTDMQYQVRNWYYFNWLSGDHIVEQHIHNLDVINWLKESHPVRAQGMGGRQVRIDDKYGEIFDHHAVEFEYEDGVRMFSYCRHIPNCWDSMSEHAHGTNGYVNFYRGEIVPKSGEAWRYRKGENEVDAYQAEHDDLFASIRSGSRINEVEYSAQSTLTAIMGRMATYSGKMIEWDTALASDVTGMPERLAWDAPVAPPSVPIPGVTRVL